MQCDKATKNDRRRWKFALGCLLMVISLGLSIGWFYFITPLRHRADPNWMLRHSEKAKWQEEEMMYRRLGVSPDLLFRPDRIHLYGDKKWFKWLLDNVDRSDASFHICGCTFTCLEFMANHAFDDDKTLDQWYEANKDKSQEEWLRDGFAAKGVSVLLPPAKEDAEKLLTLLGKKSDDPKLIDCDNKRNFAAPAFVRYNAFRWLRDMGFDGIDYLMARDGTKLSSDVREGLIQYQKRLLVLPSTNGVGLLAFAAKDEFLEYYANHRPLIASTTLNLIVLVLIALFAFNGYRLVCRKAIKSTPAWPTSHRPDTAGDPPDR